MLYDSSKYFLLGQFIHSAMLIAVYVSDATNLSSLRVAIKRISYHQCWCGREQETSEFRTRLSNWYRSTTVPQTDWTVGELSFKHVSEPPKKRDPDFPTNKQSARNPHGVLENERTRKFKLREKPVRVAPLRLGTLTSRLVYKSIILEA